MSTVLRVDPQRGLARGMRAVVLTIPTVGGAALAHSLVDGCDSPVAISLAVGLCWPAAVCLLGARRRMPALVAWVFFAQIATHLLLESMCGDVPGHLTLLQHLERGVTPLMVLVHGIALVLTSAALGRADAGLWTADALLRAGARAVRLKTRLVLAAAPEPVRRTVPVVVDVPAPRQTWVAAQPARRGPPVTLVPSS